MEIRYGYQLGKCDEVNGFGMASAQQFQHPGCYIKHIDLIGVRADVKLLWCGSHK